MQDSSFVLNATSKREIEAATASLLSPNGNADTSFQEMGITWRSETGTTFERLETNLTGFSKLTTMTPFSQPVHARIRNMWDPFLPSHGFGTVLDYWGLVDIVENDLERDDWLQGFGLLGCALRQDINVIRKRLPVPDILKNVR